MKEAIVAIVGKPNVGKSTLFNRLTRSKKAITSEIAGTTRDRNYQKVELGNYKINLVDTGGLEYGELDNIESNIQIQAKVAINEADIIVFMLNGQENLSKDDYLASDLLRKSKKPVILVANKCDNSRLEENLFTLFELGFGEAIAISTIHGRGIDLLENEITKTVKKLKFKKITKKEIEEEEQEESVEDLLDESRKKKTPVARNIKLCLVGQPNSGKSTLFNALIGEEKSIVSDMPGTTRDAIDTEIEYNNQKFTIIDTAGLRRRGKIEQGIEKFSTLRTYDSIEQCDIVILLIDVIKGITNIDPKLLQFALDCKKGVILAINKSDKMKELDITKEGMMLRTKHKFAFLPWSPLVFISAKNKKNTTLLLDIAKNIFEERQKWIPTNKLNDFFKKITNKHSPISTKFNKPRFTFANQVDINPPRFVMFFSNELNLHFSYKRFLENALRKEYGFEGTSVDFIFKRNPEKKKPKEQR